MEVPIVIDFETKEIKSRPAYPPEPVGVGIQLPGRKANYFAWGHEPGGNNCTRAEAKRHLKSAWKSGRQLMFHHAKFDLDVAETFFDLPLPPPHMILCTMIEAFLYDPNEENLGLKELAYKLLGIPPEERDAVRDWLFQHAGLRRKKKGWAAHIWRAPGDVVAPYCCADLGMTKKLHAHVYPWVRQMGMEEAYMRERKLIPVLLDMERRGIPVDATRLKKSVERWEDSQDAADAWIRKRLGKRDLNVNSNDELADALEQKGKVDEWVMTEAKDPKRSVSVESLDVVLKDRDLFSALRYRASMGHSLRTNVRPWLEMAEGDGKIYTIWNQVRQKDEGKRRQIGARTGRLSSTPNVQNVSNKPVQICFSKEEESSILAADDEAKIMYLPQALRGLVLPLPWMRDFITALVGHVLLDRDYAQQEPRILAHFVEGVLLEMYREDPFLDFHGMATESLNARLGTRYLRKSVKQVVLAIIYARGILALAEQFGIPEDDARKIKRGIRELFPGIKDLDRDLRRRAALDEPFRTWGGRVYYCEPPKEVKGRWRTWEYKMINTLIQGSAADNIKEAMIRYYEVAKEGRMINQAHDELVVDAPKKAAKEEMRILRDVMESVEFDVPMYTDGKWGPTWGQLRPFKETRRLAA